TESAGDGGFVTADDDLVGRTLGKYRLTRRLGAGGMGVVYLARDTRLQRDAAVKVLSLRAASKPKFRERFLREARAAASFSHPQVVTIYEIDEQDDLCFMAMELLAGSMLDLRNSRGKLTWRNAARAIVAVCRALVAAHAAGLVHRDIKPANILWSTDGQVKLSDFGLVKVDDHDSPLTTANTVMGTPSYMSPEQCRGETVDDRSDLYSLGATFYDLLTGHPPFTGATPIQTCFAHCNNAVPSVTAAVPEAPDACDTIIQRAMAKEPCDRYASAADMLADLSALLASPETGHATATPLRPTTTNAAATPAADAGARSEADFNIDEGRSEMPSTADDAPPSADKRSERPRWLTAGLGIAAATAVIVGIGAATTAFRNGGTMQPKKPGGASASGGRTGDLKTVPGKWQSLFDGRTLANWLVLPKSGDWSVQGETLVGRGKNSYLLSERDDYENFDLLVECRLNATGNSGVFFRCEANDWLPVGFEANLELGNLGRLHDTRSQPNTKIPNPSVVGPITPGQWFTCEVSARGRRIIVKIDGRTAIDFTSEEPIPLRGRVGLQCYEPNTTIEVRRFQLREP
ncbi:MAG TPA: protein kinase, partial [Pirellulaceae bacterium]|nr:protein kinase [Pirellulaceae bacterium]